MWQLDFEPATLWYCSFYSHAARIQIYKDICFIVFYDDGYTITFVLAWKILRVASLQVTCLLVFFLYLGLSGSGYLYSWWCDPPVFFHYHFWKPILPIQLRWSCWILQPLQLHYLSQQISNASFFSFKGNCETIPRQAFPSNEIPI